MPLSGDHVPDHTHTMKAANAEADSNEPAGKSLAKAELYCTSAWDDEMHQGCIESYNVEGHYNVQPSMVIKYLIALTGTVPPQQ